MALAAPFGRCRGCAWKHSVSPAPSDYATAYPAIAQHVEIKRLPATAAHTHGDIGCATDRHQSLLVVVDANVDRTDGAPELENDRDRNQLAAPG